MTATRGRNWQAESQATLGVVGLGVGESDKIEKQIVPAEVFIL